MFDAINISSVFKSVVEFLSQHLAEPALGFFSNQHWIDVNGLAQNTRLLAAVGIVLGATLAIAGARLLLFATVLLLATPDLVAFMGQAGDSAAYLTKVLYVVGVVGGALGLLEATLKLVFGRDVGSLAFATVIGTAIATLIPFIPRRR